MERTRETCSIHIDLRVLKRETQNEALRNVLSTRKLERKENNTKLVETRSQNVVQNAKLRKNTKDDRKQTKRPFRPRFETYVL